MAMRHTCMWIGTVAWLWSANALAATLVEGFAGPSSSYGVTVLNDGGSALSAGPANGAFEVTGTLAPGTEPKVLLQPSVALRAGDSWAVEASFQVRHDRLAQLATRDSLQGWISVESAVDGDDDVRAKMGLVKGPFSVGPLAVNDGYFVSSGILLDDDWIEGSGTPTEYSFIDPAAAGPSSTVAFVLRVAYDATLGELTTAYKLGAGSFLSYPLEDGAGQPAPSVDPLVDWGLASDDALEISLLFSATQAAGAGGGSPVTAGFDLLAGDVRIDDLVITGTFLPVPEPQTGGLLACGVALLAWRRRAWRRRHGGPPTGEARTDHTGRRRGPSR